MDPIDLSRGTDLAARRRRFRWQAEASGPGSSDVSAASAVGRTVGSVVNANGDADPPMFSLNAAIREIAPWFSPEDQRTKGTQ